MLGPRQWFEAAVPGIDKPFPAVDKGSLFGWTASRSPQSSPNPDHVMTALAQRAEEEILVIPAAVIDQIGQLAGFEADVERFLHPILQSDQLSFQPRSAMESDPSFKQLIPYVLLECREDGVTKLFSYTRGGGGGEHRLHALRSVGIGGHISREDAADGGDPYHQGMHRELAEEVHIDAGYEECCEGLIYDPSNEVGRVHLGVVHRFRLTAPRVTSREADLANGGFVAIEQLRDQWDRLETWSQLAIEALY